MSTPGDPAAAVDAIPLRYGLDEGRHYSDLGFMLLGRIIAAVTGAPLDAAVRELVTAPLGLGRNRIRPVRPARRLLRRRRCRRASHGGHG